MSKKYDYKNFDTREWVARRKKNNLFRVASIFLALAILIGGFVGVWSTGVIQKAIYNSQDLPDYVSYVDHTHSYKKTVVEPTCTEQGYTLYECRYCDMSYKQDYTATIDHDYQEVVLEQATTTSYGKAELVCSMCGDVKYEITLPLVGHTFTSEVVEPTCTEDGYTIHRSTDTDDVYIDEVIPATGHSMRLKDNYFYCETCGVMEYIEDCVEYGCIRRDYVYADLSWDESQTPNVNGDWFDYASVEYWYADSNGVLYLAGDQYGASWLAYLNEEWYDDIPNYTEVVYLDTAIRATASHLPNTVTEVTFLADYVSTDGTCDMDFPDSVETVVIDGDYENLFIEGIGIKSLSVFGNIKNLACIVCPSLEEIELGEGIEKIGDVDGWDSGLRIVNFGKVETVVFTHSAKYIRLDIYTYSREYLEAYDSDRFSYGFDWSAYLPNMTYTVSQMHYLPMTPEAYLEWNERATTPLEEYLGFSYEEYVIAYEAYTAYWETLEATSNDKPIFVVQEGTESIVLKADSFVENEDFSTDYYLTDLILFLPTTITSVDEGYDFCENVTIYYAGSQTDLMSVVTASSLLAKSAWKECVICNTSYIGQ